MRVLVVGCGSIGRRHIGNLLALGCDVGFSDASMSAKARTATDYPAAHWADDDGLGSTGWPLGHADAMVIATPWNQHLEYVELAIQLRTPFFVEKPLGSLEQLPRWRELAAMDLPVSQVGYMLRHHSVIQAMRDFVGVGDRGGFYCDCDARTWPGASYGPMLLECSHELDLALWCGAPPVLEKAVRVNEHNLHFWLGTTNEERWLISMEDRSESYVRHWMFSNLKRDAIARFHGPSELGDEMYLAEMKHFLDCVRDKKPTLCPLADGLKVLEVAAQVEAALKVSA